MLVDVDVVEVEFIIGPPGVMELSVLAAALVGDRVVVVVVIPDRKTLVSIVVVVEL